MYAMELLGYCSKEELIIYNVPSAYNYFLPVYFLLNYVTETKLTLVSTGCNAMPFHFPYKKSSMYSVFSIVLLLFYKAFHHPEL